MSGLKKKKSAYRVLVRIPEGENHLGNIGVDGTTVLKWFLNSLIGRAWTGVMWLKIGTVGGLL